MLEEDSGGGWVGGSGGGGGICYSCLIALPIQQEIQRFRGDFYRWRGGDLLKDGTNTSVWFIYTYIYTSYNRRRNS